MKQRVVIFLGEKKIAELIRAAAELEISVSELIRRALDNPDVLSYAFPDPNDKKRRPR